MFSALSITEAYTTNESLFEVWLHAYEVEFVASDCELVFPIESAILNKILSPARYLAGPDPSFCILLVSELILAPPLTD